MLPLSSIIAVIVIVTVTFIIQRYPRSRSIRQLSKLHGCQDPPYEVGDIFGIAKVVTMIHSMKKKTALTSTMDLFARYGDTYATKILTETVLFTCNPHNIKHVLSTRFIDFDSATVRPYLFDPITEHGILAVDGQEWKEARDLFRSQFSSIRSIANLDSQEQHIQRFLRRVPATEEPIDLQGLFLDLFLDITSEFALGEAVDCQSPTQSEGKRQFVSELRYVKEILARNGFLGPLHRLLPQNNLRKSCRDLQAYVEIYIEKELEAKRQRDKFGVGKDDPNVYNMLKGLTEMTTDVERLRDTVLSILIGGIDTVAGLLSVTFWILAQNNRVFQKLRASILDNVGQEIPSYDQLKTLTYLRHVFNEVLRLYPPIPFNSRMANKDTTLPLGGGPDGCSSVLVKKGQRIVFSAWASHRSTQVFGDDALEFRPERWENIKADKLGYVPFNSGPRICPGQQFGFVEASYAAVRLLQTFSEVNIRGSTDFVEEIKLSLLNENGVIVDLVRA